MTGGVPCCAVRRPAEALPAEGGGRDGSPGARRGLPAEPVAVPGGASHVGTDRPVLPQDGEGPRRAIRIAPFRLEAGTVTNRRFADFVAATGYRTEAERFGWSFVFHAHARGDARLLQRVPGAPWWRRVDGACWSAPEGPGSSPEGREDHPVVHISHADAEAFACWCGGRLPTEAEWEHAARAGRADAVYPWGDREPDDDAFLPCNIWQGTFPDRNLAADGYETTAPARSFDPNPWGFYNLSGNVWEWTSDRFRIRSLAQSARRINEAAARENRRVLKGGSFLCHRSYCHRYRIAARIGNAPDSSTTHTGFRVAYDAASPLS